jgi:predicted GIY-YIG superfamily endonuclease
MIFDSVIYILRLEGGKYYVGKSSNAPRRFNDHFKGRGARWTKLNKPIQVEDIIENKTLFTEDNVTKQLMLKYGIDNVRGGVYARPKLSECDIHCLKKELWALQNLCFLCGGKHFMNRCHQK